MTANIVEFEPYTQEGGYDAVIDMLLNLGVEGENILFDDFGG